MLQTLPRLWRRLCTPVLLEGCLSVLALNDLHLAAMYDPKSPRCSKRALSGTSVKSMFSVTGTGGSYKKKHLRITNSSVLPNWRPDTKIYIDWKGEPVGIPDKHLAQCYGTSTAFVYSAPACPSA